MSRLKHLFACSVLSGVVALSSCGGKHHANTQDPQSPATADSMIRPKSKLDADNVHCSLRDSRGMLWFATTADGVYRTDGRTFTNFTTKDGLISNAVYSMQDDGAGTIWFGTDDGLCRYDGRTFTALPMTILDNGTSSFLEASNDDNIINSMVFDRRGILWCATERGVFCHYGNNYTSPFDRLDILNPDKVFPVQVMRVIQDKNGNIWFTTRGQGVFRFDGTRMMNFKPNSEVWFAGIFQDRQGHIWLGSRTRGIYHFDGTSFRPQLLDHVFGSYVVNCMLQDRNGAIWFATEADVSSKRDAYGGIWRYDGQTMKNFTTMNGLPHNSVFTMVEDGGGALWIGGRGTSLSRFDGSTFTVFSE
jgi:ligand-binding sensor domain-containing protein